MSCRGDRCLPKPNYYPSDELLVLKRLLKAKNLSQVLQCFEESKPAMGKRHYRRVDPWYHKIKLRKRYAPIQIPAFTLPPEPKLPHISVLWTGAYSDETMPDDKNFSLCDGVDVTVERLDGEPMSEDQVIAALKHALRKMRYEV
jgi:hypothetical protein